ncbi:MAG: LAGLIDADG family homing endonuclease [Candidatus Pacearchaeota archaeon]|jgi:hypothetical protein
MVLKLNKNFAILYGIMLGDGCLSLTNKNKKIIFIAGSLKDDIPFFEKIIKPIIKNQINKDIPIRYKPQTGSIQLNFVKNDFFDFIHSFGFPIGKKGNQLFVPKVFYEKNLIKYLIKGFFATDGSLVLTNNNGTLYPRIEANGIAKNLIKEISIYLNSRNIKCNLYLAKRVTQTGYANRQEQYRIQINGKKNLKKFIKLIGFINPKQIERLNFYEK